MICWLCECSSSSHAQKSIFILFICLIFPVSLSQVKNEALADGGSLEVVKLHVLRTNVVERKRTQNKNAAAAALKRNPAAAVGTKSIGPEGEALITVPLREWETLKAQVLELAQQNIDLTKVLSTQLMKNNGSNDAA